MEDLPTTSVVSLNNFTKAERDLETKIDNEIKYNEMCFGSPMAYEQVYKQASVKLQE